MESDDKANCLDSSVIERDFFLFLGCTRLIIKNVRSVILNVNQLAGALDLEIAQHVRMSLTDLSVCRHALPVNLSTTVSVSHAMPTVFWAVLDLRIPSDRMGVHHAKKQSSTEM